MKINIGHRDVGYQTISILENKISDNSKPLVYKYAQDNTAKHMAIVSGALIVIYSALSLAFPDMALATGVVNTQPLDTLFKEIYYVLVKVMAYLSTPIWAWVGYTFAFAGNNVEKRTVAKKIAIGLVLGTGITLSAPWLTDQLFALWRMIYA